MLLAVALAMARESTGDETSAVLLTPPPDRARINRMKAAAEGWDPAKQPLEAFAVPAP